MKLFDIRALTGEGRYGVEVTPYESCLPSSKVWLGLSMLFSFGDASLGTFTAESILGNVGHKKLPNIRQDLKQNWLWL